LKDTVTKEYMADNKIFADAFNIWSCNILSERKKYR